MNKRKPDAELALINLSYFTSEGKEVIVHCPESKLSKATQNPRGDEVKISGTVDSAIANSDKLEIVRQETVELVEKRLKIYYGDTGYSFESVFKNYLLGAAEVILEDPYVRQKHQITNFLRFCELLVKIGDCKKLTLITGVDDEDQQKENILTFDQVADNLFEHGIEFRVKFSDTLHDREVKLSNGWSIKMGRGLDYFQSLAGNYLQIGVNDYDLRPCLETSFDFYRNN
jgi:ATP-dependent Lon protease